MHERMIGSAGMGAGGRGGLMVGANMGALMAQTIYEIEHRDANGRLLERWCEHNRVVTAGLNKLLDATFKSGLTSPAWYIGLVGPTQSDGVMTSGSPNFASAAGAFAAGDAGRAIIVRGAGASGADLSTTILTYTSATAVVLNANAGTTVALAGYLVDARAADVAGSHAPWTESSAYSEGTRQAFTAGTPSGGSVDNSASKAVFTINANNTLIGGLFMSDLSTKAGSTGTLYGMAPFSSNGFRQLNTSDTLTVTATASITAT